MGEGGPTASGERSAEAEARALAAGQTAFPAGEPTCQITTAPAFALQPPAIRVSALTWGSGFRGSGLRPNDLIVAVDGVAVARPAGADAERLAVMRMIGGLSEAQAWAEAGRKEGDRVTLTIRRRRRPQGWETLEIAGTLRARRSWRSPENRPLLGPNGPEEMVSDGFLSSWSSWWEKAAGAWERAWAWHAQGMRVSAVDIDGEGENARRIALLLERYPGPFADAAAADWAAVQELLGGREYALAAGALDFRALGERRAQEIADAGKAARGALLAARGAELVAPFPAIDPILGDRSTVAGKLVELPRITQRAWVSLGDRTAFVWLQGRDCYVAEVRGRTEQIIVAQRRYERLVRPDVTPAFDVVARITGDPTMVVYADVAYFALAVEPVAATVGDALFVDLAGDADPAPFAGEELLRREAVALPPAGAQPQDVFSASVGALKVSDIELWTSLFADWTFQIDAGGRLQLTPWGPANLASNWELARRRIMDDVVDMRVVWADDPQTVFSADAFEGAPHIEQTTLEVDHLRLDDDGVARSFGAVGFTRFWTLQRRDGGPWRIATNAGV